LTLLTGADAKQAVSGYLQVLYEANPAAVGGSLPGDDFYYTP
jgi:NitT/TauT family transport system substrate-binding protein